MWQWASERSDCFKRLFFSMDLPREVNSDQVIYYRNTMQHNTDILMSAPCNKYVNQFVRYTLWSFRIFPSILFPYIRKPCDAYHNKFNLDM